MRVDVNGKAIDDCINEIEVSDEVSLLKGTQGNMSLTYLDEELYLDEDTVHDLIKALELSLNLGWLVLPVREV